MGEAPSGLPPKIVLTVDPVAKSAKGRAAEHLIDKSGISGIETIPLQCGLQVGFCGRRGKPILKVGTNCVVVVAGVPWSPVGSTGKCALSGSAAESAGNHRFMWLGEDIPDAGKARQNAHGFTSVDCGR